jgi:anti-sigma regulatory factor (Ser/Thr protein kinase)
MVATVPLELDLPADAASVGAARHAIAEYVAGSTVDRLAVEIAVSEAVSNAVLHAYRDGTPAGRIAVRARFGDGLLHLEVADGGVGMAPRPDSPGLGLGLPLIAQLAAQVEIVSEQGTTVLMDFGLAP